ncbi:MAG: family 1 glycosylhydrolase [Nitriliruptorales bacterium]|nr:family 1 glycosylhydrolase [Nitriliruptorales bacterium]
MPEESQQLRPEGLEDVAALESGAIVHGLRFPRGFEWGAATSAYQVEGGLDATDWSEWERQPRGGCVEAAGDAVDHYHRFGEDIALLADLGLTAYRFSIEWSRVQPRDGEMDEGALDHYEAMVEACHAAGLSACVALHHFTNPLWVSRDGGWENPRTVDLFTSFCTAVARRLGPKLDRAITINEPNMPPLLGYLLGRFPPGKRDPQARERVTRHFLRAHEQVRDVLSDHTDAPVGMALAMVDWQLVDGGEEHLQQLRGPREDVFLQVARDDDYIGVNTYTRHRVGRHGFMDVEEGVELTHMGYEFWPDALEATVRRAAGETRRPVVVTECGIGTKDDARRIVFIAATVRGIHNCLAAGVDVRGYHYWSALDNFEWNHGYAPQFGIVAVDRTTQQRRVKPSGRFLGRIARDAGLP